MHKDIAGIICIPARDQSINTVRDQCEVARIVVIELSMPLENDHSRIRPLIAAGSIQPLGSDELRKVDVRLVATTKADLKDAVRSGQMREDFYHRISVLTVAVPPLRERVDDMPLLLSHFIVMSTQTTGRTPPDVPESFLERIARYGWPGNVRELKNVVERMVVTSCEGVLELPSSLAEGEGGRLLSLPATAGRLRDEMERVERLVIDSALREHAGEITATHLALGISRRALYERMKKYGLRKENYRR